MKIRIKKKVALKEESGAGAIVGGSAPMGNVATIAKLNKDEEDVSSLEEMYSSQVTPVVGIPISSDGDDPDGLLERDKARGLQNVKGPNEDKKKDYDEKLQEIQQFRKKMLRNLHR